MKKILSLFIAITLTTAGSLQAVKLELNLVKGETYTQKMEINSSAQQTFGGQEINVDMVINTTYAYKVKDIQNDLYDIEASYKSMSIEMKSPLATLLHSSEMDELNDNLSRMLKAITDVSFFIKLSKTGKIMEVSDLEAIFSDLMDEIPGLTGAERQQMKAQLTQNYGKESFTNNLETIFAIFPEEKVSKGDKWDIHTVIKDNFTANVKTVYELTDVTEEHYHIVGNAKVVSDSKAVQDVNGMPVIYNIAGETYSNIKLDKESGWIISAKMKQSFSGTLNFEDSALMPGGMEVPLTMKSTSIISNK